MSSFSTFNDTGGIVFREATSLDLGADAFWFRFHTAADMYRLSTATLPTVGMTKAFLLTEILPGAVNPKLSEFQGAFGRAKLLEMNRRRIFRRKLIGSSESFFLDGASAFQSEDWRNYLRSVYNTAAGFLLVGNEDVTSAVEGAIQLGSFSEFLKFLILRCHSVLVLMEDHRGMRSIVFVGNSSVNLMESMAEYKSESSDAVLESVRAYGDRLANRGLIERALRVY